MIPLAISGWWPIPRRHLRSGVLGTALLLGFAPTLSAATGENSPVTGYLDIKAYGASVTTGVDWTDPSPNATKATANTQALQAGLDYAYAHSLVAYLPLGTYQINDTLKCDSVGINGNDPVKAPHHQLVGEVNPSDATARPLIKIATSATAWDSVSPVEGSVPPKPIIRFRHDQQASDGHGGGVADGLYDSNQNFYSMLRGVNFDTSTKGGAAGVQMDAAQNSSIENVKVTATSSYAGFYGLPSRSWGGINLEVEGGKYGIYHVAEGDSTTIPTATGIGGNAGSTIAGATLKNQTSSAIRFKGAGPLTIVGLEVVTPSGHSAINIPDGTDTYGATLVLLDGKITMSSTNDTAILNSNGRNLYLREIWVTGTDKLVKSGSNATITQTGTWKTTSVSVDDSAMAHGLPSY